MSPQALTPKQARVYAFLKAYVAQHAQSPYIREIQSACEIVSYKSVVDRLLALERKGWIHRLPNAHRGIRLLTEPTQEPLPPVSRPLPPESLS